MPFSKGFEKTAKFDFIQKANGNIHMKSIAQNYLKTPTMTNIRKTPVAPMVEAFNKRLTVNRTLA